MNIVVVTKQGMILKFDSEVIRKAGRGGKGVKAINLAENDEVVSAFTVDK